MGGKVNPQWVQGHCRWYQDDAAIPSATPYENEDVNATIPVDTVFRLRQGFGEAAGQTAGSAFTPKLEFFYSGVGGWTAVGAATDVQYANGANHNDGDSISTSNFVLTAPTGCATASAGEVDENNTTTDYGTGFSDNYTEIEWTLKIAASVGNGFNIQFRLVDSAGDAIDVNDKTPLLTTQATSNTTGTAAQTLPSLTQSASGTEEFIATGAQSLPSPLTQVATGLGGDTTGAAAQALSPITQSATGEQIFEGTADQALPALTQTATGEETFSGAASQALPSLTQSATGDELFTGAAAQSLPSLTQSAAGEETFTGSAAQDLPALTQSATGNVVQDITGAAAQALPSLTQSASGEETFSGSAAQSLPSLSQSATGAETFSATAAQTLPSTTQSAAGEETFTSAAAQALPSLTQSATGAETMAGSAAQSLPSISQSATGTIATAPLAPAPQGGGGSKGGLSSTYPGIRRYGEKEREKEKALREQLKREDEEVMQTVLMLLESGILR